MIEMRKPQKASILWLQGANTGILLPEGLSRFAFRRSCPVECLPNEMQSIFHRGEAYSSGVSEKQKNQKLCALCASACPMKFMSMRSEANFIGAVNKFY